MKLPAISVRNQTSPSTQEIPPCDSRCSLRTLVTDDSRPISPSRRCVGAGPMSYTEVCDFGSFAELDIVLSHRLPHPLQTPGPTSHTILIPWPWFACLRSRPWWPLAFDSHCSNPDMIGHAISRRLPDRFYWLIVLPPKTWTNQQNKIRINAEDVREIDHLYDVWNRFHTALYIQYSIHTILR